MNISYNWLKDLIDPDLSPEETASALTRVGLAVEGTHAFGDDQVFDIDLTSNRPDCLSHLGVARELRVITGKEFPAKAQSREEEADDAVPLPAILAPDVVKIEAPELCYRFTARTIRGVKIGPSPEWLVKRLEAVGERSINNVADVTNYVMLELGQPMHAFDMDKLAEKRIVVRRAKAGEAITTLDEVDRKLDESMLMICDAENPVAVGGVMGGLDSSITESTVNVLLEVAYFDRASIRQTSRKLGLQTEASYRFERGVDIANLKAASDRAASLIADLAGGQLGEFIDVFPHPAEPVEFRSNDISAAVRRLTGLSVSDDECLRILSALGITSEPVETGTGRIYRSPTWRHDIAIEEDLVEEVARHAGYENIGEELPPAFGAGEYQASEVRKKLLRQKLVDIGFDETITYSFIDTRFDEQFALVPGLVSDQASEKYVTLRDSVIEAAVRMRPTLLPGLVEAVRFNLNHQRRDLKLFEIGKVFASHHGEDALPAEREMAGFILTGGEVAQKHLEPVRPLDFYDAKGAVEAALEAVGFPSVEFRAEDADHLRPGQSAGIYIDGGIVGYLGRLSEQISSSFKFRGPVFVAEVDLDAVLTRNPPPAVYRPLPRFPSVMRDVSFIVDRQTTFEDIRSGVIDHGAELCRNIGFIDIFEGKGIDPDKRSLTVRLEYRSDERTLIEDEVGRTHDAILETLRNTLGITPRI